MSCAIEMNVPCLHTVHFVTSTLIGMLSDLCTACVCYFCLLFMQVVELDLSTVEPCCSGPKRPQDRVAVSEMKQDFETCLGAKVHNAQFQHKPHQDLPFLPNYNVLGFVN